MGSSKLRKALCVLAVVSGPVLAAEDPPKTNQSRPIINKQGTTLDGPASPTVINEGNFKPQSSQRPGTNPKSKSGAGGNSTSKKKNQQAVKSNILQKRNDMGKNVSQSLRGRTVPQPANNKAGMSHTDRKKK